MRGGERIEGERVKGFEFMFWKAGNLLDCRFFYIADSFGSVYGEQVAYPPQGGMTRLGTTRPTSGPSSMLSLSLPLSPSLSRSLSLSLHLSHTHSHTHTHILPLLLHSRLVRLSVRRAGRLPSKLQTLPPEP